jgi:protease IV
MLKKTIAATLICSSALWADALTTLPATVPATQAATQPTTVPATSLSTQALLQNFPTPAELAQKMLDKQQAVEQKIKVAHFDLSDTFLEKPADFSLFGEAETTLRELIARIDSAGADEEVKAALFYVGSGTGLKFAQAQEVRDAIADLRRTGKKTFVYADTYDTTSYAVATGATNICLMPGGEIFVPGIGFETMFFKGAFDKLGITADYVQIGEYKGAEEPFTRSQPSEELKGEMNKLVDAYYSQIVAGISLHRNLKTDDVRRAIDGAIVPARQAQTLGWIDHLVDADGLRQLMKDELGDDVNILHHYGEPERAAVDFSNPFAFLASLAKKPVTSNLPKVAVVYAEGTIVDGSGGEGMLGGQSVGSDDIRRAMRLAARDENIKAIVIRIDSPGGSALASEAMWQSVRRVAKDKPVVISIGSMAASGGYYLASAGDYVVADSSAIVGSIGVVGGKFVMNDLYEKLGITTMNFSRGANADLFSATARFDDKQKRMVKIWMKNTYDQFTDRINTTRGKKIKDIDQVARGRIFLAQDAKALGMVDEIGGLNAAIAYASQKIKLEPGEYDVKVLPEPATFADILSGRSQTSAGIIPSMHVAIDSPLNALPGELRGAVSRQLQMIQLLQNRPVVLMSPWVISTK